MMAVAPGEVAFPSASTRHASPVRCSAGCDEVVGVRRNDSPSPHHSWRVASHQISMQRNGTLLPLALADSMLYADWAIRPSVTLKGPMCTSLAIHPRGDAVPA